MSGIFDQQETGGGGAGEGVREKGDQSCSSTDWITLGQMASPLLASFLICKMKTIIPVLPPWQGYCEHQMERRVGGRFIYSL